MPNKTVLASLRGLLQAECVSLREQLAALGADGETELTYDENFADSGQVAAEQGEARVLAGSLGDQLHDVERALEKIDEGNYGRCERCGEEIAEARLEAMPATRFCIKHA